jgi:histidine triad (HIT) family protein
MAASGERSMTKLAWSLGRRHDGRGRCERFGPFVGEEVHVTAESCLFCRIAAGEIPAKMVRSEEDVVAFRDVNPQAPLHVLVIPRRHIPSVAALEAADAELVGRLFLVARDIAREEGVEQAGYRLVMNVGPAAGQSVPHVHLHVLGGRELDWPPG